MSDELLKRADAYVAGEPEHELELIRDLAAALREARAESESWKEKYGDANVWGLQNAARWKDIAERAEAERDELRALLRRLIDANPRYNAGERLQLDLEAALAAGGKI